MNINQPLTLTALTLSTLLMACGGSDSNSDVTVDPVVTPATTDPIQGNIIGPLSTGTISESMFAYYDLDTKTTIELTSEEALTNTEWDVAFKRSGIYLNQNTDNAVTALSTGNNSDFFDADGKAIQDSFVNATAETELENYLAITTNDIPTDETLFIGDVTSNIIDEFYTYDSTTHVISVADTNYFILNSDEAFTKFRVTEIVTAGRGIGKITINTAYQGISDVEFAAEQSLIIDTTLTCSGDVTDVYIDFDTNQEVTIDDAWDISLPCAADKTGADFAINIADDAQALHDFDDYYTAVDSTAVAYYGFKDNVYSVKAFDSTPWYQYGINGGHLLWSQFDVYLVKTPTTIHKLQITSYYDELGTSGNISFRADEVNELAGVAN